MIIQILLSLVAFAHAQSPLINQDGQIPNEVLPNKCLAAVKPDFKNPYKYVVSTSCDTDVSLITLVWERYEAETIDGLDFFKIRLIPEPDIDLPYCMGFSDSGVKVLMTRCNSVKVVKIREDNGFLKLYRENESKREKCLVLEDVDNPADTVMAVKIKTCVDHIQFDNDGGLSGMTTALKVFVFEGLIPKRSNQPVVSIDNEGLSAEKSKWTFRSDNRIMLTSSGDVNNLEDVNSECLTQKLRGGKVNKKGKEKTITRKTILVKCTSAIRYYIDNTETDDDKEIHAYDGDKIKFSYCLQFIDHPKWKNEHRLMLSACKRNLGTFDTFTFKGDPNE